MTSSTTRHTPPAATPRAGTRYAALPHDPGLDAILAQPALGPTAKLIAIALVKNWAWVKDHCWPADATIAARVGRSPGHVQRCLRELERAGHIARERTDAIPTGRRIWLLWRRPDGRAGAQGGPAPAREDLAAPARSERVVVVNEGREPEDRLAPRSRPEATPPANARPDPMVVPPAVAPPAVPAPHSAIPESGGTLPAMEEEQANPPARAVPGPAGGPAEDPAPSPGPPAPGNAPTAPDPTAIGRPVPSPSTPASSPTPRTDPPASPIPSPTPTARDATRRRRPGLGLTLEELVRIVGETADPILAGELARRTAPPAPPEPPPQALPTPALFARLPGRHDLIAAATHRLAEATGDFRPASWSFFRQAVEAVVTRSVSPELLLDCHRQATSPKAKAPGKVFVTSWKREAQRRCETPDRGRG